MDILSVAALTYVGVKVGKNLISMTNGMTDSTPEVAYTVEEAQAYLDALDKEYRDSSDEQEFK